MSHVIHLQIVRQETCATQTQLVPPLFTPTEKNPDGCGEKQKEKGDKHKSVEQGPMCFSLLETMNKYQETAKTGRNWDVALLAEAQKQREDMENMADVETADGSAGTSYLNQEEGEQAAHTIDCSGLQMASVQQEHK